MEDCRGKYYSGENYRVLPSTIKWWEIIGASTIDGNNYRVLLSGLALEFVTNWPNLLNLGLLSSYRRLETS